MTNKEAIFKTIQFIDANLQSIITIEDMAKQGYYSRYHFIRLFQSLTGISPKQYLLQRRLTESLYQLHHSSKKIACIAYDYQFNSHEVFTRAFRRYFGITPSQSRKGTTVPNHLLRLPIIKAQLYQSPHFRHPSPKLIELKQKMFVGLSHFVPDSSQNLDLTPEWTQFMHLSHKIKHKTSPEHYVQIQSWSDSIDLKGMYYYLGVEVDSLEHVSPEFVLKIIPKGSYLKFVHKGLSKHVGYTYQYIYHHFLSNSSYQLPFSFNFEWYGPKYLGPTNEQSESFLFIPVNIPPEQKEI